MSRNKSSIATADRPKKAAPPVDPSMPTGGAFSNMLVEFVPWDVAQREFSEQNYSLHTASVAISHKGELLGFVPGTVLPVVRDMEMQRLVDATASKAGKADAIQARMRAKAVELVMNGTSWLTASELFAELPKKPSNAHTVLSRWLEQGRIFAMEKSGVRIYPRYAFDAMVEPVPLLREVLKVLAGRSPFQIASWFESPSNYLDGKRPREVLETNGLGVVTAAQRLVEGAVHG